MQVFVHNTNVTVSVPFVDENGNSVTPTSGTYRVLDEARSVLVAGPLTIAPGDTSASITVLAAQNTLAVGVIRGMRVVELILVTASGTKTASTYYVVEASNTLVKMTNSYQTLENAELLALDLPELTVWSAATQAEKRAALVDAYHRLGTLAYSVGWNYDQSKLSLGSRIIRALNEWTISEFDNLPDRFKSALLRAQIVEADIILGGDNIGDQRREGLMSHSVGESSQMYRPGKPVMLTVSNQALKKLSGFVTFNTVAAR